MWNSIRPLYDGVVAFAGKRGIERTINGTDSILLTPRFRAVQETYEPELWNVLMRDLKPDDTFVDVGVFIGLYTVAAAQRIGALGRIIGFEPDRANYAAAAEHVELNAVGDRVTLIPRAVGAVNDIVSFQCHNEMGRVVERSDNCQSVECVTLDSAFADEKIDVLKIDVEGYEEHVLRGATTLLQDSARAPRVIYVEVHPYAWAEMGTSSETLLGLLTGAGYGVANLDGTPVTSISEYGEIIARRDGR